MEDSNINAWVNSITKHLSRQASSTLTIPKVPERLRRGEIDAYEPRIISFGPYHHGKPRLQAMEKYKWRFLEVILSFRREIQWERYIEAIEEEEAKIRTCYTDDFDIDSEEFVEMMLIDGCFLVGYLLQFYYGVPDELDSIVGVHYLIRYDILLLENQLPFFILIKIFELLEFTPSSYPSSFMDLAINYLNWVAREEKVNFRPPEPVDHLLHLYHSHCINQEGICVPIVGEERFRIFREEHQPPCATVLYEAGVNFERKEAKGSSSSSSCLDVTFNNTNGKMMIPPLVIDSFTKSTLRNLVAFEQLYPDFYKLHEDFTAYVQFMDFIVNTPADVALLNKKGIIRHFLGSDKDAANFINNLNQGVSHRPNLLALLYKDVYHYRQKRRPQWQAVLMHDYCNSPWAVLGLVVGGILLVFTFFQTICSGISTF